MATNLAALQGAIKLVADAALDTVNAIKPGQSTLSRLLAYKNLVEDVVALVPQIGDIPAELKALQPADAAVLASSLAIDLALPAGKAADTLNASLKLLSDLVLVVLPDVEALVAAIKEPAAPAAPAAPEAPAAAPAAPAPAAS